MPTSAHIQFYQLQCQPLICVLAHSKGSRGLQASSMRRHLAVFELASLPVLQWCCRRQCAGIFAVIAMAAAL
jgi:hypothetical protein